MKGLAKEHQVELISFIEEDEGEPTVDPIEVGLSTIQAVRRKGFQPGSLNARLAFFNLTPRSVIDTYSKEMAQRIDDTLKNRSVDLVIASQFDMAVYSKHFIGVPAIFEEVEIGLYYDRFSKALNLRERFRNGLTWLKHSRYLDRLLNDFSACTVVSLQEREILSSILSHSMTIQVVPNFVDLDNYRDIPEHPEPDSLIFTGGFSYFANHDAMSWFMQFVYPLIRQDNPHIRVFVTGNTAGKQVPYQSELILTGFVDDVRPLVANASISLAPIRIGGGTRLKILEAMALRTPVVSTTKGAEGLEIEHGTHLLVADTPEEFARAVLTLLNDPDLRANISNQAYELVREKYSSKNQLPRYLQFIEGITLGEKSIRNGRISQL